MSVWTRKTSGAYITKLTSHQPPESELELSEPEISTEQPTHWQPIDPVGSQVLPSPFVCHQPCSSYTSLLDSIGSVASNIDTCQTCFLDFNFWLQTEHEVVKGYDEKYNMEEEDSFENKDKEQEEERQKMESERSKQPFKTSHWKMSHNCGQELIFHFQACHPPCPSSLESSLAASLRWSSSWSLCSRWAALKCFFHHR